MEFAEKEHKKLQKKDVKINTIKSNPTPIWFDKKIKDEELSSEEEEELKKLLKEFN